VRKRQAQRGGRRTARACGAEARRIAADVRAPGHLRISCRPGLRRVGRCRGGWRSPHGRARLQAQA